MKVSEALGILADFLSVWVGILILSYKFRYENPFENYSQLRSLAKNSCSSAEHSASMSPA